MRIAKEEVEMKDPAESRAEEMFVIISWHRGNVSQNRIVYYSHKSVYNNNNIFVDSRRCDKTKGIKS